MAAARDAREPLEVTPAPARRGGPRDARPPRVVERGTKQARDWPCPCRRRGRNHPRRGATASWPIRLSRSHQPMKRARKEPELQTDLRDERREREDQRGRAQVRGQHDGRTGANTGVAMTSRDLELAGERDAERRD